MSSKKAFGSKIVPDFSKRLAVTYKEQPVSQPIKIDEPVIIAPAAAPQVFQQSTAPVVHAAPITWSSNEQTQPIVEPAPLNDGVLILENTGFAPDIATYPSIGESYFLTSAQASGDVTQWSQYPAINDVDLNGNNLNNVVYVNSQIVNVGTANLSEVNDNLLYNGVQVATVYDVATWSENPAVGDVNMLNNSIIGLSQINGYAYPPPPPASFSVSTITVNPTGYISTTVINGVSSINGSAYPPSFTVPSNLTLSTLTMNPAGYISSIGELALAASTITMNSNLTLDGTGEVLSFTPSVLRGGNVGQLVGISTINGLPYGGTGVVTLNGIDGAVSLAAGSGISISPDAGAKTITINANAPGVPNTITGQNTFMTATGGTLASANANITAGGGTGGNITAIANAGDLGVSGGNISMTANGGTGLGGLFGVVNLTANPGTDLVSGVATGGAINILANSPSLGLTSKVSITGGGVNIYSGIFTPLASVFGYTFINASLGVSIVSGGFSPFPQSAGTTYIYSAQGTVIDNGLYVTDIQPIWDGNPLVPPAPLTIHGRTAGGSNVPVILNNVETLSMQGAGAISGVNTINGSAYPPPAPTIPANLNLSTLTIGPAGTISFTDIAGPLNTGYILGLPAGDLTVEASAGTAAQIKGGYTADATPPGSVQCQTLNRTIINPLQNTPAITAETGLLIGPEGATMAFPTAVGTVGVGCGQITNLSTINGVPWNSGGGSYPPVANFSSIIMNESGTISASSIFNTTASDLNISQENVAGSLALNVSPGGTGLVGQVNINTAGTISFNELVVGSGIKVNPEGNTLTFVQSGVPADQGQIVGLSTINGIAYNPSGPVVAGVSEINAIDGAITFNTGDGLNINSDPGTKTITYSLLPDINLSTITVASAGSINFTSGDGAITNLSTINGVSYLAPPSILPYTLTGTKGGGVIVNRPIGSGNPFPSNTFTIATTITFNIPTALNPTDGVYFDGFILFDFSANFNSFWGVNYFTNTFPTPTDILGSTTTTANALNFSNIQQIYLPLNLLIPNTNIVAGGTITLQVYCSPTSTNHYITITPVINARIGIVID